MPDDTRTPPVASTASPRVTRSDYARQTEDEAPWPPPHVEDLNKRSPYQLVIEGNQSFSCQPERRVGAYLNGKYIGKIGLDHVWPASGGNLVLNGVAMHEGFARWMTDDEYLQFQREQRAVAFLGGDE